MKKLITSALVLALVMTILPVSFTGVNAYSNEIENVRVAEYNTSARISWETRDKALSRVYYGTNPDKYETLIKDETRSRDHLLTLKALDPDTTYYYKLCQLIQVVIKFTTLMKIL